MIEKIFSGQHKPFLWIFLLGILLYGSVLTFDYIRLDDQTYIVEHHQLLKDIRHIPNIFGEDFIKTYRTKYYRPLLPLSFLFDAQISGKDPFMYHLTNLLLHIVTSCFLFLFFQRCKVKPSLSFAAALLFLVHPGLTSNVAWVAGRTDILSGLFVLGALLLLAKSGETKSPKAYWGHLLCFLAALLSKESSMGFVFVGAIFLSCIQKPSPKTFSWKKIFLGWGSVILFWALLRSLAVKDLPSFEIDHFWEALLAYGPATLLSSLGKFFWPYQLSLVSHIKDLAYIGSGIATLVFFFLLWRSRRQNKSLLILGITWFAVFLLPSVFSSLMVKHLFQFSFLENRLYVPCIGLLLVLTQLDFVQKYNPKQKTSQVLLGILLTLLSVRSFFYSQHFKNPQTFWEYTVNASPHSTISLNNLGAIYHEKGLFDRARITFERLQKLAPQHKGLYTNLGLTALKQGQIEKGHDFFREGIKINPDIPSNYSELASQYLQMGKTEEAIALWEQAIKADPTYMRAYISLIQVYRKLGNEEKAQAYIQKGNPYFQTNLSP